MNAMILGATSSTAATEVMGLKSLILGNTLYEIEPLQSDFQWDNSGIICLRRPLEICNVTIDENNHCVVAMGCGGCGAHYIECGSLQIKRDFE